MNYNNLTCDAQRYLCRFYEILSDMIKGMNSACLADSISHNFIVQMIPHHRAAIEMSENLLIYSHFAPLELIAENIIKEQTKSIEDMENVLMHCGQMTNTQTDLCMYQKRVNIITGKMFSQMRSACAENNINANFMREMIPHHMGAIKMSKNALQYPICPELDPILRAIIKSQEKGIREMQGLLQHICCL